MKPDTSPQDDATLVPNASPATANLTDKRFGDYELIEEIARGGMGVVYKSRHLKLNRICALKMMLGGRFTSADELQRFQVEAEAAARLDHPGIVPVYDIGEQDGQAFFAMKYIAGGSLAERMSDFRKDRRKAIEMLATVARAVNHAHQRGILHRDLKPANILIDEDDNPLITDLGLAKSTAGDSNLTKTGAVLGTPSYMPPEQAAGDQAVTTAADIFSLGAMMYELLTGRPPHQGSSSIETVMKVLNDTPAEPRKLNREIDSELELICLKCIERKPEDRYQSSAAFGNDLNNWLSGTPISIKPPSLTAVASRWIRQHKRLAYIIFATFMALAFTMPMVSELFGPGSNLGEVYDHFPNASRPWMFPKSRLPDWLVQALMLSLICLVWPMLGLWNAMVTRPDSFRKAVGVGFLTSAVVAFIAVGLLGWLVIILDTASYSSSRLKTVAEAIWTPDGSTSEEARDAALAIYEGLEDVPEAKRAEVLTDRVVNEQIARGPRSMMLLVLISSFLGLPVVYGTVIAWMLTNRRQKLWKMLPRYVAGWVGLTVAISAGFTYAGGNINGQSARNFPGVLSIVACVSLVVVWLVLRRWKKKTPAIG